MARRTADEINADVSSYQQQLQALEDKTKLARAEFNQNKPLNTGHGFDSFSMPFIDPYEKERRDLAAKVQAFEMEKQGLNPDGSPMRPEYESWLDANTGMMRDQYQMRPDLLDPTKLEGFQELRKRVMTQGPSAWAQMMLEKQKLEEAQQKDAAAKQVQSAAAQARNQLAMRGGMASGARERLAAGGARDLMLQRQNVASQGQLGRTGILTEDEAQRMKLLPGFAEGEAKMTSANLDLKNKAQEWNIMRALEEKRAKDSQDLAVYQEQIKKWASEKEAAATRSSGGGGGGSCWLVSAYARENKLPKTMAENLTKFKNKMLESKLTWSRFYIKDCGPLIGKMDEAGYDWKEFTWFINAFETLVKAGEFTSAFNLFKVTLVDLVSKYWSECDSPIYKELLDDRKNNIELSNKLVKLELDKEDAKMAVPCLNNLKEECFT